eukprot:scaffold53388_cov30-Tisochrysis_lutea.AAC.2
MPLPLLIEAPPAALVVERSSPLRTAMAAPTSTLAVCASAQAPVLAAASFLDAAVFSRDRTFRSALCVAAATSRMSAVNLRNPSSSFDTSSRRWATFASNSRILRTCNAASASRAAVAATISWLMVSNCEGRQPGNRYERGMPLSSVNGATTCYGIVTLAHLSIQNTNPHRLCCIGPRESRMRREARVVLACNYINRLMEGLANSVKLGCACH